MAFRLRLWLFRLNLRLFIGLNYGFLGWDYDFDSRSIKAVQDVIPTAIEVQKP